MIPVSEPSGRSGRRADDNADGTVDFAARYALSAAAQRMMLAGSFTAHPGILVGISRLRLELLMVNRPSAK